MTTANPHRGDVPIRLLRNGGWMDFVMRPSHEAIIEFEQTTGRGVIHLTRAAITGELSMTDMAVIATAGMKAAGAPADFKTVAAMIFESKLEATIGPIGDFLQGCLNGGKVPEPGEAMAADGKTDDTPSAA